MTLARRQPISTEERGDEQTLAVHRRAACRRHHCTGEPEVRISGRSSIPGCDGGFCRWSSHATAVRCSTLSRTALSLRLASVSRSLFRELDVTIGDPAVRAITARTARSRSSRTSPAPDTYDGCTNVLKRSPGDPSTSTPSNAASNAPSNRQSRSDRTHRRPRRTAQPPHARLPMAAGATHSHGILRGNAETLDYERRA